MNKTIVYLFMFFILLLAVSCGKDTKEGDITPPFIELKGENPIWLPLGVAYLDAGAKAWDITEAGDTISINTSLVVQNEVNTSVIGVYFVKYNVTDENGNKAVEQSRKVYINDF